MHGDGVINGIPAQEIAPKGVGVVPLEVRGGDLLNGREGGGRRGGPPLGQARSAVGLILPSALLGLVRTVPLFTRLGLRGGPCLSLRIVSARAGSVLNDAAKGLGAVVGFLGRGDAEVNQMAGLVEAILRHESAGLGEFLRTGGHVGCAVKALVKVLHEGVRLGGQRVVRGGAGGGGRRVLLGVCSGYV